MHDTVTDRLDLAHILAVQQHLIFVYKLAAGGKEKIVCAALAAGAQLIGGVLLEHKLAGSQIMPSGGFPVAPFFRSALEKRLRVPDKMVV